MSKRKASTEEYDRDTFPQEKSSEGRKKQQEGDDADDGQLLLESTLLDMVARRGKDKTC